jgi:catechol 2,3-dioxygenase-like lactoylglutathione lyase family enzyme
MFTHIMIGSNNIERSRIFYDALFAAIGGQPGVLDPRGRLVYSHEGGRFIITTPNDGNPATCANGGTIGFRADTFQQILAWHHAGVEHGGTAIEDPPGVRQRARNFLAYVRDPDGNKITIRSAKGA